jgi:hypothetical protein
MRRLGGGCLVGLIMVALQAAAAQVATAAAPPQLQAWRAGVEKLLAAPPDQVATARRELLHNVPAELDWLRAAVQGDDRSVWVLARNRLNAWNDALQPAVPLAPPDQVRAAATAILAERAYQPVRTASWIEPYLPYIERFFDLLLSPLSRRADEPGKRRALLAVLLYAVLIGLLTAALVRVAKRREPEADGEAAGLLEVPPNAADRRAGEWLSRAREQMAAEHREAALGFFHLALLVRLHETGRLTFDPSRTNWENVAAAGHDRAAAAALAELARATDRVVYGRRPCEADELARCETAVNDVWSLT